MRIHTGEKPFQCAFCPKKLRASANLRDQERRHLKVKPFKCELCTKSYYRDYLKRKHLLEEHYYLKNNLEINKPMTLFRTLKRKSKNTSQYLSEKKVLKYENTSK